MNSFITKIMVMAVGIPIAMVTIIGVVSFIMYRLYPIFDSLMKKADEEARHISNPFWPKINTTKAARIVARNTSEVTFIIAGMTAVFTIFKIQSVSYSAFIDIGVLIIIGFCIRKMSRIAAVIGFCFYLIAKIFTFIHFPFFGNAAFFMIFILAFANGIRATFNYHKFIRDESASH